MRTELPRTPSRRSSQNPQKAKLVSPPEHHQGLHAGAIQRRPARPTDLFSPLARPQLATHLIVGELYEVECGRIGWRTPAPVLVVLDPHKRLVVAEPGDGCEGEGIEDVRVILQHFSGYLFGCVCDGLAGVVSKLRADDDGHNRRGIIDPDPAAPAVGCWVDVIVH